MNMKAAEKALDLLARSLADESSEVDDIFPISVEMVRIGLERLADQGLLSVADVEICGQLDNGNTFKQIFALKARPIKAHRPTLNWMGEGEEPQEPEEEGHQYYIKQSWIQENG